MCIRDRLVDFWALLTNPTVLAAFPHAVFGSWMLAGTLVCGLAGWWMVKEQRAGDPEGNAATIWRSCTRFGAWTILVASVLIFATGDKLAKLMFTQQPMKMASAEALCRTEMDPHFSVLSISTLNDCESAVQLIGIPYVLPFLADGKFTGVTLQGVLDLQEQYEALYGPGNYTPNLFVTYWSFRMMIGFMAVSMVMAVIALWMTRGKRVPSAKWIMPACIIALPAPWLSNIAGWVFTEMGRQPWIVHPNPVYQGQNPEGMQDQIHMIVDFGVSDHQPWQVLLSMSLFTLIYGVGAVIWVWLIARYTKKGMNQPGLHHGDSERVAEITYGPEENTTLEPLSFGAGSTVVEKQGKER